MKWHVPRSKILRAFIVLFCLILVLTAALMLWVQARRSIRPGYDTTRIVSPVLSDGRIDYLTAIEDHFGAGVTPQNNAAIPILQALGRAALATRQLPDGITNRLGMEHLPEHGDYFIPYDDFVKQHGFPNEDDPTDGNVTLPLKIGSQTRQWIEANAKPMELLTQASKRSRYFFPIDGGYRYELLIEVQIPYVGLIRQAHRAFLTRALMRLEAGDFDGFHQDVMTVHRLARLVGQAWTLVERVVGTNSLEVPASEVERAAAQSGRLSAPQAKLMANELATMGDLAPLDEAINVTERYIWLDALQVLAKSSPPQAGRLINSIGGGVPQIQPLQAYWLLPIPYEASMQVANHYDDGLLAVLHLSTYADRKHAIELWQNTPENASPPSVWDMMAPNWAARIFLLSGDKALRNYETTREQNRLTQIALALAAYRADHKEYPASLSLLLPDYLKAIPADVFSDKSPLYSPTPSGYTLYSVGPNMTDDGGKFDKHADDISASTP